MSKRILPYLLIGLMAATSAHAQMGGGGGGRRGGGGRGGQSQNKPAPTSTTPAPSTPAATSTNQIEIVGVVQAIGPEPNRVTIAYEPVEGLNWPKGVMPFAVETPALLQNVTVGEKVRFKLESHQISSLKPFGSDPPAP